MSGALSVRHLSRGTAMPVSYAQEGYLHLEFESQQRLQRKNTLALRLDGRINADSIRAAANIVVKRHEILRTTFRPVALLEIGKLTGWEVVRRFKRLRSGPLRVEWRFEQLIHGPDSASIDLVQREQAEINGDEDRVSGVIAAEVSESFDYERLPLVRCSLIRIGSENHLLVVVMSQVISDGMSLTIFANELLKLYSAIENKQDVCLPTLAVQYADFAAWQRSLPLSLWQADYPPKVAPLNMNELPFATKAKASHGTGLRETAKIVWDGRLYHELQAYAHRSDNTLLAMLLSILGISLGTSVRCPRVLLWTSLQNRSRRETHDLIGWFAADYPVALHLEAATPVSNLIRQVNAQIRMLEEWTVPPTAGAILNAHSSSDGHNETTPFSSRISLELMTGSRIEAPAAVTVSKIRPQGINRTERPLRITVYDDFQALRFTAYYRLDICEPAGIHFLLSDLQRIARSFLDNPAGAVSSISRRHESHAESHQPSPGHARR